MARKVFISVLGAGFYEECVYEKEKDEMFRGGDRFHSSKTRFIQQATLEYLNTKEWGENDAAYILVTKKSKETNWHETITTRMNRKNNEIEPYLGLERVIKDMNLPFKTKAVDIPDGKDEKEIWEIFETIIDENNGIIQDGDELYFDLTHGFRYLPMLVLVLGNYTTFLKKTKKCSITYGNHEMRDDHDVAPIIDLLPLATLQDWTFAVADYLENGYAEKLQQLGNDMLRPILRNRDKMTEEQKQDAQNMRDLVNNIKAMALERQTCRGIPVMDSKIVKSVRVNINNIQESVISALTPLIKKIDNSLEDFDSEPNVFNTFAAAKWCYNNHQYQAATTFIEEGIISFFCLRNNIDYKNEYLRDLVTTVFSVKKTVRPLPLEEVRLEDGEEPYFQNLLNDPLLLDSKLVDWFTDFIDMRNDYNHCGFRSIKRTPLKVVKITNKIEEAFKLVEEKILPYQLPPKEKIDKPRFFFNLSNHPISVWSEEQLNAAKQFGEIREMTFPTIDPNAEQSEIEALVDEYVNKFAGQTMNSDITVHVMGEMTFTYNLVARLKALGIRCVASTTERRTHLDDDGNKVSEFKFVQFREY